jgi:hypothetical protein
VTVGAIETVGCVCTAMSTTAGCICRSSYGRECGPTRCGARSTRVDRRLRHTSSWSIVPLSFRCWARCDIERLGERGIRARRRRSISILSSRVVVGAVGASTSQPIVTAASSASSWLLIVRLSVLIVIVFVLRRRWWRPSPTR